MATNTSMGEMPSISSHSYTHNLVNPMALNTGYAVDQRLDGPWPAAGHRRNRRMLLKSRPHLVVAFPGGPGTASMVKYAKAKAKETGDLPFVLEINETYIESHIAIIALALSTVFNKRRK